MNTAQQSKNEQKAEQSEKEKISQQNTKQFVRLRTSSGYLQ